MSTPQHMTEFDVVFLSYDEPNADKNWENLLKICPWAERVHGVKGFDAAHKACALKSNTDRFITVDGDNIVDPEFFDMFITIPPNRANQVFSWGSRNHINGLAYGNGGLKMWTREFVINMKSHEHTSTDNTGWNVDFCWSPDYIQMNNVYSTTDPSGSPTQAFRAGYREGVKMALDRGKLPNMSEPLGKQIHAKNYQRLMVWTMVGDDVENGIYACLGARYGLLQVSKRDFDITSVNDLKDVDRVFESVLSQMSQSNISAVQMANDMTSILRDRFALNIGDVFTPDQSECFKKVYVAPPRVDNPLTTELEMQ